MNRNIPLFLALLALAPTAALRAADQPAADAKLREALRNTALQLRTVQGERDALQAAKDQTEQEKKALTDKLDALTKQAAANQEAADKSIAELKEKSAQQDTEIAQLKESLDKWKAAQKEAADVAMKKEAERAKLAAQNIELQRKVADQQAKNLAMFKVGNEILSRYEKFGLGTAITAREPFVGTMRVKLENLVQEYQDKLSEQRIKP